MSLLLDTPRLILRPLDLEGAAAVQRHCGNWKVARMLARVPHPYPDGLAERWIAEQPARRAAGDSFCFAIERREELVGVVGIERQSGQPASRGGGGTYELGYWIGEPWWGQGLATEAARRAAAFAFETLDIDSLAAGHFHDNPASGRVLEKCGFVPAGREERWCEARGREEPHRNVILMRAVAARSLDWGDAGTAPDGMQR